MNIKELKTETLYKEYLLEIPYGEVEILVDNKIKELIPTISLPGFRKGKAPLNIVKKKYEQNVLSEIIEKLVNDKTKNLLEEKKIKPFRQPRVEIKKYEKNQPVQIEIKVDLEPEIKLKNFKEFKLKKYEIELDKKTIEENYKQFISSQTNYKKIDSNRSIKKSDKVTINLETKANSVPDYIKSQKNLPIITDSDHQILPDISNKLINNKVKIGDKINLSFDMSKILKSQDFKEVNFEIEIITIEESVPFQINKEFLQKNGLKDENELKDNLKKNIKFQYENGIKQIEKKQLMDILDKEHQFDLPKGVVEEEYKDILHRLEHAKKDNKLDEDDRNLSDEKLKQRYKDISIRRVKLAVLLQFIAKENNISVDEKELTDGMIQYASQYPGQEKQILEYFKKNPSSIESVKGPILEQKVIDIISAKSNVQDVKISIEEYKKLEEMTFSVNKVG